MTGSPRQVRPRHLPDDAAGRGRGVFVGRRRIVGDGRTRPTPVLAELLVTLARFAATQSAAMHQALLHEQERSGTAWSLEWMVLPQVAVAACRALSAATELCDRIERLGEA